MKTVAMAVMGLMAYLGVMVATGKLLKARREQMESEDRAQQELQELRVLRGVRALP